MADLAIDGGTPVRTEPFPRWPIYGEEEIELIAEILRSGNTHLTRSTVTKDFEAAFAEWCEVKHAITCNSGTSAIHMALAAGGIGPGDEVIVPPRTFIGTVSPVLYQNAVPIFADIDPETHNLAPDAVRAAITPRTKAIIPVHLAGTPCDMDAIMAIAAEHDLLVVEDCAQAHGATYRGKMVGGIGPVNAFSMQDSKIINSTGDGGMVTTDSDEHAEFCRQFRNHGFLSTRKLDDLHIYIHPRMGYNYRMTEIQAAVGLKMMDRADGYVAQRRENAHYLDELLTQTEGVTGMYEPWDCRCSYYRYYATLDLGVFRVDRDQFVRAAKAEGVGVGLGTSAELYKQEFFEKKAGHSWDPRIYDGDVDYTKVHCPVAHQVGLETFAIEVAPPATTEDMADVVAAVRKVADAYRAGS